jgi:hypothetical protein
MYNITFAWGGCGNLINNCLASNQYYTEIVKYYQQLDPNETWTDQEWSLRDQIGKNLTHDSSASIALAWNNSLDTSFHYCIKNIKINHLPGTMVERVGGVIETVARQEQRIKQGPYWSIDMLLQDFEYLFAQCSTVNSAIEYDRVREIYQLWQQKTQVYYEKNSTEVLDYFTKLGIDYHPTTLYNILYENTNLR